MVAVVSQAAIIADAKGRRKVKAGLARSANQAPATSPADNNVTASPILSAPTAVGNADENTIGEGPVVGPGETAGSRAPESAEPLVSAGAVPHDAERQDPETPAGSGGFEADGHKANVADTPTVTGAAGTEDGLISFGSGSGLPENGPASPDTVPEQEPEAPTETPVVNGPELVSTAVNTEARESQLLEPTNDNTTAEAPAEIPTSGQNQTVVEKVITIVEKDKGLITGLVITSFIAFLAIFALIRQGHEAEAKAKARARAGKSPVDYL